MKNETLRRLLGFPKNRGGVFVGRAQTHDAAFTFRMGAGFAGDPNRTHPVSIEPCLQDPTNPSTFYGQAVIATISSANSVRVPATGDSALTQIYGVTVRPFPIQQQASTNYGAASFGAAAPPSTGAIDVLRRGYILVTLQGASTNCFKGAAVTVCTVAGTGFVVGGFSVVTSGGGASFITLDGSYTFNGPPDSSGIVEMVRT